jgi:tRNA(Ile)-lysidine synthase
MTMTNDLWPQPGERVLCAVSGGLDSMCLLHMLKERCGRSYVTAAHFNHQLRETADRDENFVRDICRQWNIPLTVGRGDVSALAAGEGLSVEEAARNLRYDFLRREAEQRGGIAIYTAHHADDNAETVLLNLLRGTGIKGLTGIPHRRDGLARPLLDKTRAELAEYAAAHGIPYVEDETNLDSDAASRNLLRLEVMPLLRRINPRAVEHINAASARLALLDDDLDQAAETCIAAAVLEKAGETRQVSLPLDELRQTSASVRSRVLLRLLDLLGVGRKDIGAVHLEALDDLLNKDGGQIDLPYGVTARHAGGRLLLETAPERLQETALVSGTPLRWGDFTLTLWDHREGEGLPLRIGPERLTVGPCPPGERLRLPGSRGGRAVKRLCVDRGIGPAERDRLPAIYADGRLAAVWRLGVHEEFLPVGENCRFIQITKEENEYEK